MKLKKFKEKNKKKIGMILFTIICILLITGVILYRTFAIFETNDNFNVINGKVEDVGDIYFAFYKDGVIQKNMPTKNEGYVLDEKQSYCGVLGEHNSDIKVSMSDDEIIHVKGVTTSRTKCNLYFVKGAYILGKGVPFAIENDGLYEVKHEDVSGTVNNSGFQATEYRYAGIDPDNYVKFNNELWRIIGLVNVMTDENKVEQRVKIVKNESIGDYSWDISDSNTNNGYGINEWSESDIMKLLNPGYDGETANNSLYWNGLSGSCYNRNSLVSCNFQNGLNRVQDYIEEVIWNTGSNGIKYNYNEMNVYQFYEIERSNLVATASNCSGRKECNDSVTRKYNWKGKVGLIYPSDYGYATNEKSCQNEIMYYWGHVENCYNNWLHLDSMQWTITPCSHVTYGLSDAFVIGNNVLDNWSIGPAVIRSAIYLKNNIYTNKGTGTLNDPYIVSILNF